MNLGRVGRHVYELHVLRDEHALAATLSGANFVGLKLTLGSSCLGLGTVIEIEDGGFTDLREVKEFLDAQGFRCEIVKGHK
jgi:hypothetical protein